MASDGKVTQLRRTYRGEQAWFGVLDRVGHRALRRAFIQSGIPARVAGELVFFVEDQMMLERHQSERSRVRYRDFLEGLDPREVERLARRAIPGLFNSPSSQRCA